MSNRGILREAASRMRARAEDAQHPDGYDVGRWVAEHHGSQYHREPNTCHIAEDRSGVYWTVASEVFIPNAEHMAGLDPRTALRIAAWLDQHSRRWLPVSRLAVEVARSYLRLDLDVAAIRAAREKARS